MIAYWEAFDKRRPIGCHEEKHASVMAMLEGLIASTINPNLKKEDRIKPRSAVEFLPLELQGKKPRKRATLKQQLAVFAKAFGGMK